MRCHCQLRAHTQQGRIAGGRLQLRHHCGPAVLVKANGQWDVRGVVDPQRGRQQQQPMVRLRRQQLCHHLACAIWNRHSSILLEPQRIRHVRARHTNAKVLQRQHRGVLVQSQPLGARGRHFHRGRLPISAGADHLQVATPQAHHPNLGARGDRILERLIGAVQGRRPEALQQQRQQLQDLARGRGHQVHQQRAQRVHREPDGLRHRQGGAEVEALQEGLPVTVPGIQHLDAQAGLLQGQAHVARLHRQLQARGHGLQPQAQQRHDGVRQREGGVLELHRHSGAHGLLLELLGPLQSCEVFTQDIGRDALPTCGIDLFQQQRHLLVNRLRRRWLCLTSLGHRHHGHHRLRQAHQQVHRLRGR
mmetsp:Transcript_107084/g.255657  ORF Transcript_107084/g.255657 Transcript_107084/m.255657 type:complete len:362 (+) Transcript_107084:1454-2539(+)